MPSNAQLVKEVASLKQTLASRLDHRPPLVCWMVTHPDTARLLSAMGHAVQPFDRGSVPRLIGLLVFQESTAATAEAVALATEHGMQEDDVRRMLVAMKAVRQLVVEYEEEVLTS